MSGVLLRSLPIDGRDWFLGSAMAVVAPSSLVIRRDTASCWSCTTRLAQLFLRTEVIPSETSAHIELVGVSHLKYRMEPSLPPISQKTASPRLSRRGRDPWTEKQND